MQHSFWPNSPDGARRKSILVACICTIMTVVAVSSSSKQVHCNPQMLVLSAFEDCSIVVFLISLVIVVFVTHAILWFESSPSIRILNSYRDVLRSYEHNLRQFLSHFQPGWSWYGQPFNSSRLKCLLNLFCIKWILMVIWKHQVNLLEKQLLLQK